MSKKTAKLLCDEDPEAVTIIKKSGNIIFSGPHNGRAVPKCLTPFMGMDEEWFNKAHDSHDLHMDRVFQKLNLAFDDASLIWGNYSRLLFDLNSIPEYAIKPNSSEKIVIPANQSDQCCYKQTGLRFSEIYGPYHGAKTQLIHEKREANNGGVIVLDLHSFTPSLNQVKRNVEIGTIRCEKTPFSYAFEEFLKEQQSDFMFVSGEPYRVQDSPTNAARLITDNNNLQYLGLEIRNDLIETDEGIDKIVSLLKNIMTHLSQPKFIEVTKKRNIVKIENPANPVEIYGYQPI